MSQALARQQTANVPLPEHISAKEVSPLSVVTSASDLMAVASPAQDLRSQLEEAIETRWNTDFEGDTIAVRKIPVGWTMIGMSVICAAFWYALATVIL